MNLALLAIGGVVLVVASTVLAPKVGVAAPLLLVVLGFAASLTPWIGPVTVPPDWILAGVLPPLLYSAAVSTPVMEARRDFRIISLFSVVLVAVSALVIGVVATVVVPGLPLGVGIALGAVISPTDAVATSIVRRAGVSQRLVTVLEGESMLNDASALVLLRSAVAAVGVGISVWHITLQFVWAVVAAIAIGVVVGRVTLLVRGRISDATTGVAVSLVVPFLAYIPTEHLGASGLVAAVTAGVVTGDGAPHKMGAGDRMTDRTVWRTIELLLESGVFLLIGLELPALARDLTAHGGSILSALAVGVLAAAVVVAIRAVFVAGSVWALARRNRRQPAVREKLAEISDQLDQGVLPETGRPKLEATRLLKRRPPVSPGEKRQTQLTRWRQALDGRIADLDYLAGEQFGWRDGIVLVWAGMRGAVTVAAAQTLPEDTPHRSFLVLVATLVAVGMLIAQGSTLSWLASRLGLTGRDTVGDEEQWTALQAELSRAALSRLDAYPDKLADDIRERLLRRTSADDDPYAGAVQRVRLEQYRTMRLDLINAERDELLVLRRTGSYPSAMLDAALVQLDAEQIGIELRRPAPGTAGGAGAATL
ncbi:MAG TPA: sodium:proton antiporter [Propionibacteriaceae bacterium]|nr:sodium:proton antiporter [Propionibacteriaceae bacterium]